jgi:hypothetical protein
LLFMSSGNYASLDLNFLINEISIGEWFLFIQIKLHQE